MNHIKLEVNRTLPITIFLFLAVTVLPIGCTQNDSSKEHKTSTDTGILLPQSIVTAALPAAGTLTAQLFMDGSLKAENSNVDKNAASITFTLSEIEAGDHTFTIKFAYTHPVFNGPWELATASKSITVVQDATNTLDFDTPYIYPDSDNDGVTNLAELDESVGTDPGSSTCVFDKSIIGVVNTAGCTLG